MSPRPMAASVAPARLNSFSCARNCATCSRQKIQPQWRRKTMTAGFRSQSEPSRTSPPPLSGSTRFASLALKDSTCTIVSDKSRAGSAVANEQVHMKALLPLLCAPMQPSGEHDVTRDGNVAHRQAAAKSWRIDLERLDQTSVRSLDRTAPSLAACAFGMG